MKIGIDLTSTEFIHDGGKDQFVFNLLKGFCENNVEEKLILYSYQDLKDTFQKIAPNASLCLVQRPSIFRKVILNNLYYRTFILPKLIEKTGAEILFFPKSYTGFHKFSIPTILNPHDIQLISHSENFNIIETNRDKILLNFDFRLRDRVIAISKNDMKSQLQYFSKYTRKIEQIYNPIQFPEDTLAVKKEKMILCVNIGFAHKNVITLVKAFELIAGEISHNLVLVGKIRKEVLYLVEYIRNSEFRNRIKLVGFVEDEELEDYYLKSELLVTTSTYEGFGMVPVEALGRGLPVIASRIPAHLEVTMGKARYYSPVKDHVILASEIKKFLHELSNGYDLESVSEIIRKKYDLKIIASQYLDLFRNLLLKR